MARVRIPANDLKRPFELHAAEYEKNRAAFETTCNAACSNWVDTIVERCTKC